MTLTDAVILGAVEGITEYLPVSSTGHLILTSHILGLEATDFLKSFEISIQLGAITAVVTTYWRELTFDHDLIKKIAVAFVPTGILGFSLYKVLKSILLENTPLVLGALFFGGIFLILFEVIRPRKELPTQNLKAISYRQSFLMGMAQSISIVPGVSRAAATIVGGMLAGIDRKTVVEFSFLLAVPTMIAATGYDISKNLHTFSYGDMQTLATGLLVSFATASLTVKLLLKFIQKNSFLAFGIYRVALASTIWFVIF